MIYALQIHIATLLDEMGRLDEAIDYAQQAVMLMREKRMSHTYSGITFARVEQILSNLNHKREDVSAKSTDEEDVQAFIAELVMIYKVQGEAGLRVMLKQNRVSDDQEEMLVQIVKDELGE